MKIFKKPEEKFWNSKEQVTLFSNKPPSIYVLNILSKYEYKSKRVLDLGCGGGRYSVLLASLGFDAYGLDASKKMLEITRHKMKEFYKQKELSSRFKLGSMLSLPYPDNFFDIIVSTGVFHQAHSLNEYQQAIRESSRVLKPGGILITEVFTSKILDSNFKQSKVHRFTFTTKEGLDMTLLSVGQYKKLLYKHGFVSFGPIKQSKINIETGPRHILRASFMKKIKQKVKIGVLGGIGPEATGEFYNKLIKRLQERGIIKRNTDFPQIVINSIPAPELTHNKISDKELIPYIKGLKELDNFGVDFIVMVCNTIHLFYNKLQKEIKTPILNLRQKIKRLLDNKKVKSILIIGTSNTIKGGLYKFKGIKPVNPNKEEMKQLDEAIFNLNKGLNKQKYLIKIKKIINKYLKSVDLVILGCTELCLLMQNKKFSKINTIEVLVDATIRLIEKENKK